MRKAVWRLSLGLTISLLLCNWPAHALAAGWVEPVPGCVAVLSFAEQYRGHTHTGIDLAAPVDAEVSAPCGGTVLFAGRVPADGGGTCGAVTIELPDGLRVSLLPLTSVFVSSGDSICAGDTVGLLAASGDDSSQETHLHVGLRRGDAYIDPAVLLPPGATAASSPTLEVAAAPAVLDGEMEEGLFSGEGNLSPSPIGGSDAAEACSSAQGIDDVSAQESGVTASEPVSSAALCQTDGHQLLADADVPESSALRSPAEFTARGNAAFSVPLRHQGVAGAALLGVMTVAAAGVLVSRRVAAVRVD